MTAKRVKFYVATMLLVSTILAIYYTIKIYIIEKPKYIQYRDNCKVAYLYLNKSCFELCDNKIIIHPPSISDSNYTKSYISIVDSLSYCYDTCKCSDFDSCYKYYNALLAYNNEYLRMLTGVNRGGGLYGQTRVFLLSDYNDSIVRFVHYPDTLYEYEPVYGYIHKKFVHEEPAPKAWRDRTIQLLDSIDIYGIQGEYRKYKRIKTNFL